MKLTTFLTFGIVLIFLSAFSQIPATLSYQGLLTDANGVPVADGNHTILFKFYTASTGGSPASTRGTLTVATFKGLFTAILGNGQGSNNNPVPYTLGETEYFIGIDADDGAELVPRISLTAVPYAFVANTVKSVDAAITQSELITRKLQFKTRKYLTGGGKEYVSDGIAGRHSPFAKQFIDALYSRGGNDGILTLNELMTYLEKLKTAPQFGKFGLDNQGSEFVFVVK